MNEDYVNELLAASPEEQAQWVEAMAMHTAPPGDFMAGYRPPPAPGAPPPPPPHGGDFSSFLPPPVSPGIAQAGANAPVAAYTAPAGQAPQIPPVKQLF